MEWNEFTAYLAGYVLGDGCIWGRYGKKYINISSCDKQIIEDFANELGRKVLSTNYVTVKGKDHVIYKVEFYDEDLYNFLTEFGVVPNKSNTGCNINIPDGYASHVIRGLFDSDGSVSVSEHPKLSCKCYIAGHTSYIKKISEELKKANIQFRLKKESDSFCRVCFDSRYEQQLFYEFLYKDASVFLQRKHFKFKQYFDKVGIRKARMFHEHLAIEWNERSEELKSLKVSQMAEVLGCSIGTAVKVKNILFPGRRQVRISNKTNIHKHVQDS